MIVHTPFCVGPTATTILANAAGCGESFAAVSAIALDDVFDPALLQNIVRQAADARFTDNDVADIGLREVETPQRLGKMISLLLSRPVLLRWLEEATGIAPIGAVAGQLVQTRCNGRDALDWHDDLAEQQRQLGVVINLSTCPFEGGDFELRPKAAGSPMLQFKHSRPGTMLVFAVRPDIEHRVTPLTSGGPRRVYSGWFLESPEHAENFIIKRNFTAESG